MDCRMYVEAEVGKKVSRKCQRIMSYHTWYLVNVPGICVF